MSITGPRDGQPYKAGVAVVDVLTGLHAAPGCWRRSTAARAGA